MQFENAGCGGGDGVGGVGIGVLPSLAGGFDVAHMAEIGAVVGNIHLPAVGLIVVAAGDDADVAQREGTVVGEENVAGLGAAERKFDGRFGCWYCRDGRQRIGVGGDVFIITFFHRWKGKLNAPALALDDGVAPHHSLHRLLGLYPRTAAKGKTVGEMYAHFQSQTVGDMEHGVHPPPPFG